LADDPAVFPFRKGGFSGGTIQSGTPSALLLKFRVLRLGLFQDGDVGVGISFFKDVDSQYRHGPADDDHVRMQRANLRRKLGFTAIKIGLIPNMYAPWASYSDVGAGARVAHRIALNTWQGTGVPPRPPEMAGLRRFKIRFQSPDLLRTAVQRIGNTEQSDGNHLALDPDGNVIVMA
jgi:hypothetical protein